DRPGIDPLRQTHVPAELVVHRKHEHAKAFRTTDAVPYDIPIRQDAGPDPAVPRRGPQSHPSPERVTEEAHRLRGHLRQGQPVVDSQADLLQLVGEQGASAYEAGGQLEPGDVLVS